MIAFHPHIRHNIQKITGPIRFGKSEDAPREDNAPGNPTGEVGPTEDGSGQGKPVRRKLTSEEKAAFRARDQKAEKIRHDWPVLLRMMFPMPPNGEIKHSFIVRAEQAFRQHPFFQTTQASAKATTDLFSTGKSGLFQKAERAFQQQLRLLQEIAAHPAETCSSIAPYLLELLPKGAFRDEVILSLYQKDAIEETSPLFGTLSSDDSRARAVRLMIRANHLLIGDEDTGYSYDLDSGDTTIAHDDDDDDDSPPFNPFTEIVTLSADTTGRRGVNYANIMGMIKDQDILISLVNWLHAYRDCFDFYLEDPLNRLPEGPLKTAALAHAKSLEEKDPEGRPVSPTYTPEQVRNNLEKTKTLRSLKSMVDEYVEVGSDEVLNQIENYILFDAVTRHKAPLLATYVLGYPFSFTPERMLQLFKNLSSDDNKIALIDALRMDEHNEENDDENAALAMAAATLTLKDRITRHKTFNRLLSDGLNRQAFVKLLKLKDFNKGYELEKTLLLRTLLLGSIDNNDVERNSPAQLLFSPMRDEDKTAEILGILHLADRLEEYEALVPAMTCAVQTLTSRDARELVFAQVEQTSLSTEDNDSTLHQDIQELRKLSSLTHPIGYDDLFASTLQEYLQADLPLRALPRLLQLMGQTGRDVGEFITEVVPGYQSLLTYALQHPDRLVAAGENVPEEVDIREYFRKHAEAIVAGVIVTGVAPLKQALFQKKLDDSLQSVVTILGAPNLIMPLHQLSRITQNPNDVTKLLQLTCSFISEMERYPLEKILRQMVQNKKLDLKKLGSDFLKEYFKQMGLKVHQISEGQLGTWNMEYISELAQALKNLDEAEVRDLKKLCVETAKGNYEGYINNTVHKIGRANAKTRKMFQEAFEKQGIVLDYDAWLHYDGVVAFDSIGNDNASAYLLEELNAVYAKAKILCSPNELATIKNDFDHYGYSVDESDRIVESPRRARSESLSLDNQCRMLKTIQNRLFAPEALPIKRRFKALAATMSKLSGPSQGPMEIKLWQRQPGYDLFQGCYTGACTALGNSASIPEALEHTFVQIAELRHVKTNKTVGKALFFWIQDLKTGEPVLVLNTFEGRGKHSNSCEYNPHVRDQLLEFARAYGERVAGRPVPILIGQSLNPLYVDDLEAEHRNVRIIGRTKNNTFYLDAIDESTESISKNHYDERFHRAPEPMTV